MIARSYCRKAAVYQLYPSSALLMFNYTGMIGAISCNADDSNRKIHKLWCNLGGEGTCVYVGMYLHTYRYMDYERTHVYMCTRKWTTNKQGIRYSYIYTVKCSRARLCTFRRGIKQGTDRDWFFGKSNNSDIIVSGETNGICMSKVCR